MIVIAVFETEPNKFKCELLPRGAAPEQLKEIIRVYDVNGMDYTLRSVVVYPENEDEGRISLNPDFVNSQIKEWSIHSGQKVIFYDNFYLGELTVSLLETARKHDHHDVLWGSIDRWIAYLIETCLNTASTP